MLIVHTTLYARVRVRDPADRHHPAVAVQLSSPNPNHFESGLICNVGETTMGLNV